MTNLQWFRCRFDDWSKDEVATLDLDTLGFLLLLRLKVLERGKPVDDEIALGMARRHGRNKRTVDLMLAKLIERGLIVRAEAGVWCDDMADEVKHMNAAWENICERNAKVSRNRVRKTKQNMVFGPPEEELEIEGRPTGAPSEIPLCNTVGCGTPSAAAEASTMSAIDLANIEFGEAIHEACAEAIEGHLDYYDLCGVVDEDGDDDIGWNEGRDEDERQSKRGKQ